MELEEFENKIRSLWEKPIDELENPEFIKYCENYFETSNDIGFFYYKDQINFKKFHIIHYNRFFCYVFLTKVLK